MQQHLKKAASEAPDLRDLKSTPSLPIPKCKLAGRVVLDLNAFGNLIAEHQEQLRQAEDLLNNLKRLGLASHQGLQDLTQGLSVQIEVAKKRYKGIVKSASIAKPVLKRGAVLGDIISLVGIDYCFSSDLRIDHEHTVYNRHFGHRSDSSSRFKGKFLVTGVNSYYYSNFDLYRESSWIQALECSETGQVTKDGESLEICVGGIYRIPLLLCGHRDVKKYVVPHDPMSGFGEHVDMERLP